MAANQSKKSGRALSKGQKAVLSVKTKLLFSFAAIAISTIAATSVGFYSFTRIESSLNRITGESVPSMAASMTLAQRSGALESAMPLLAKTRSDAERESVFEDLNGRVDEIRQLGGSIAGVNGLVDLTAEIEQGLVYINDHTRDLIADNALLHSRLDEVIDKAKALDDVLLTGADDAGFDLMINSEEVAEGSSDRLNNLIFTTLQRLNSAVNLKSAVDALAINLSIAVNSSDDVKVQELLDQSLQRLASFPMLREQIGEGYLDASLSSDLADFRELVDGSASIFGNKLRELDGGGQAFMMGGNSRSQLEEAMAHQEELDLSLQKVVDRVYQELVQEAEFVSATNSEGLNNIVRVNARDLRTLLEARANNNLVLGILTEASQVTDPATIELILNRFNMAALALLRDQNFLSQINGGGDIILMAQELLRYGAGDQSIFNLRRDILETQAQIDSQLAAQRTVLANLFDEINQQVELSKSAVAEASEDSSTTIESSRTWMGMFALGSLVITVLIVWLLVSRYLLGRLMSAIEALRKLADGDLDCEIKVVGHDELSELAKTVDVFRARAIETQRLQEAEQQAANEREQVEEERRRLEADNQKEMQVRHQREIEVAERERAQAQTLKEETDALLSVVQAAAQGDLTQDIHVRGEHPTGLLADGLRGLIASITRVMNEITQSAQMVASNSKEIARGNSHLSDRTEQQASSLQETAASMMEMTDTVRQNTENAQHANKLARQAQERAEQGSQVVTEAVTAMGAINDSSAKITEIVGVIDEIAFQTNLLALNASVEAARAGEQGRGFAVVASEVRNLAARSATAAKEIKELIEDSVEKVNLGVKLVGNSGTTLDELLVAVKQVTDIVGEIVSASEIQSSGIQRVNEAVMVLDEMTQQNAALVEEAAAASESMADQSVKLQTQVGYFNFHRTSNDFDQAA